MKEVVESFCSPSQLRFLFTHILLNIPVAAIKLFDQYQEYLSADYLDQFDTAPQVIQYCLPDLSRHLATQSARLSDFGLPDPEEKVNELFLKNAAFFDQQEDRSNLATLHERLLFGEEAEAYHTILDAVESANSDNKCFFLDGKARRGKTFTLNVLVNRLRGRGAVIVISGSTALSITLYERGRTAHSVFRIPVVEVSNMNL